MVGRHPLLLALEPDARVAGRARLGHGVGTVVGLPLAIVTPLPASFDPFVFVLLLVAGLCYCLGLMLAYAALTIGKVSIVAPIVATEGAVAAVIAIALGDTVGLAAGVALAAIAAGVVMSSAERSTTDVPVGDIELVADALAAPLPEPAEAPGPMTRHAADGARRPAQERAPRDRRRADLRDRPGRQRPRGGGPPARLGGARGTR